MAYKSNVFGYYNGRAVGMPEKYLIRFVNYDGTVLQESYVFKGKIPIYAGETPEKPIDPEHNIGYVFSGWSPTVVAVTADATYTAQYTQVQIALITFRQPTAYGASTYTTLQESYWKIGDTPVYSGSTPAVGKTNEYVYTYSGWDNTITEVATTDPVVYTAQFAQGDRLYTLRGIRPSSVGDNGSYSSYSQMAMRSIKWNDSIDATSILLGTITGKGSNTFNLTSVIYVGHMNANPKISNPKNVLSAPSATGIATVTTPTSFTLASLGLTPVYDSYYGTDDEFWCRGLYEVA